MEVKTVKVKIDPHGGTTTVSLPNPADVEGSWFYFEKVGEGTLIIETPETTLEFGGWRQVAGAEEEKSE